MNGYIQYAKVDIDPLLREPGVILLYDSKGIVVGRVAKRRGPVSVIVKEFLVQKLSYLVDKPDVVAQNRRLNEFVLLSLSSKRRDRGSYPLHEFLSTLDTLSEYDLELCASILGGDALELPTGTFFPLTRIDVP